MPRKSPAILIVLLLTMLAATPLEAAMMVPTAPAADSVAAITIRGYGRNTIGGSSGRKIWVTNLRDSGPGSLRAALEANGSRLVQFRVAGTIVLQEPIKIKDPYLTVAGNSAPAKGIQIRGAGIIVTTHEVILRHLRLRLGDVGLAKADAQTFDPVTLNGVGKNVYNVVLDHVSLAWGPDIGGLAILGNVHHVTIQNSIIGEGLRYSKHPEGQGGDGHSMAVNVSSMRKGQTAPSRITFFHNLLTTSDVRMPRVIAASCIDFINNLIYNWGAHAGSGNPRSMNMVGNWWRRGPRMIRSYIWWPAPGSVAPSKYPDSVYLHANRYDGFAGRAFPDPVVYAGSARCGGLSVTPTTAGVVYGDVLNNAGVRLPRLDSVDARIIRNVRLRLGAFYNGIDFNAPHPYWPSLTD